MGMNFVDLLVFGGYLVAVVALGFWTGRGRRGSAEDYFLAGRDVPWYAVGLSFIGSNISTEHFIGMVGAAYLYGIAVANWEWANVFTFSILIWIFIPFLLATRVFSAPEFLERRFNGTCRLLFAVLTVVASIVAFLAAVLYAGAISIDAMFDVQGWLQAHWSVSKEAAPLVALSLGVVVIGVTTGAYSIFGGLNAVIWTDVFQVAIMFIGGLLVTLMGLAALGQGNPIHGWRTMVAANRGQQVTITIDGMTVTGHADAIEANAPKIVPGTTSYRRLALLQPLNHTLVPWPDVFLVWLSVGIWYCCVNQFMIQRVLAARDRWHARMGIVFAGFMKIFLPFIIVVPGLIMFAMDPHMENGDKSYPLLVQRLIPIGLKGLILATLFGAIQSTVSAVLNSTATVITLDIYGRFIRRTPALGSATGALPPAETVTLPLNYSSPDPHAEPNIVRIGQSISAVVLLIAMLLAPLIMLLGQGVFVYIQNLYAHFAPPFSALFLVGMLWKRANAKAAVAAIVAGMGLSLAIDYGPQIAAHLAPNSALAGYAMPFLTRATLVWLFCVVLMVVVSLATERPPAAKITDDTTINWKKLNIFADLGYPWYRNVVFWWAIFVAGIGACYVAFL